MNISISDTVLTKEIMREERWNIRHAHAYNRYRWLSSRERWRKIFRTELAGVPSGTEVFEIGTGTGFITEILVSCGYRVNGIDLSPSMLAVASDNLSQTGCIDKVRLSTGDAESLQTADNQVGAVVSRWVLWTLPKPHDALAEMVRVLQPGGTLICVDGQYQTMAPLARLRASLTDFIIAGRIPGWHSSNYVQVKHSLPRLDGPEVAAILQSIGLEDVSFRRLSAQEIDGRFKNWLMGGSWQSYMVTGRKPG